MLVPLQTIGWIACVIYSSIPAFWLVIHPHADYWRWRRQSPYRVLIPLWIAMWVTLALITAPWRHVLLYRTIWTWIPAAMLFAAGLWLYKASAKHFSGAQLGGMPELSLQHPEQRLVTSGIRSRLRHPVYLAHVCEMLGWSISTGLVVCYVLTAFGILSGAVMIRLEDKELENRFGAEYVAYRRRVPALFPKFWI